jgi:hypothetical protein
MAKPSNAVFAVLPTVTVTVTLAAAIMAAVAGCTGAYSLVAPGRVAIDDEFSVKSTIAWSELTYGERHLWTVDGAGLDAIWFYAGIADGEALIANVDQDEDAPRFDADMRPSEVMELVVDSLSRAGAVNVEASGLRPAAFGAMSGYRFELTLQTAEGLIKRGLAIGTIDDAKLQLIVYLAAGLYYYDKYRDEAESIFASVEMI